MRADPAPASPFGTRLRQWRTSREISQLALAAKIGSTPRHLSFLETGRSRPSRRMVIRLGEALQIPLRERNQLLHAAGLPAAYPQSGIHSPDLAPYRAALNTLLEAHLPYPAMVLDSHWNVLMANPACARLYGDVTGSNLVRRFLADPAAAQFVINWPQVAWAGLDRLRHQLEQAPLDAQLAELVTLAEPVVAGIPRPDMPSSDLVVCLWFQVGDQVVKVIGMAARFESTAEVTLDELHIELAYPLDEASDRFFRQPGPA